MDKLKHKTIFKDDSKISVSLPLALIPFHDDGLGSFYLTEDPQVTKKASIIGMFVLRPATESWSDPNILESMYDNLSWTYNLDGLDGKILFDVYFLQRTVFSKPYLILRWMATGERICSRCI